MFLRAVSTVTVGVHNSYDDPTMTVREAIGFKSYVSPTLYAGYTSWLVYNEPPRKLPWSLGGSKENRT